MNFKLILLLEFSLLINLSHAYGAVAAEPLPVASATSRPTLIVSTLSHAELWKRMWLSDFIDDTARQSRLVDQAKAARGDEKIALLKEAALYGHIDSMIELGQRYAMKSDGIEALRWYVLGFEEQWMNNGTHHPSIVKILKGELASNGAVLDPSKQTLETLIMGLLQGKENNAKQKGYTTLFTSFKAKTPKGFFDKYGNFTSVIYQALAQQSFTRCFLSNEAKTFRKLRFEERDMSISQRLQHGNDPWAALIPVYKKREDYPTVQILLERGRNHDVLHEFGGLYDQGHIGRLENGTPNYEKAAECYRKAQTPNSWYALGLLHARGHIGRLEDGTPNYEKAAECYRKAQTREAWNSLGFLYAQGHIGRLEDGTPDYEQAKKIFEEAQTPSSWCNLGFLYFGAHIGRLEDGTPNYEKAAECYRKTQTPNSWNKLGFLYFGAYIGRLEDGTPNYAEALLCASQAVALGEEESIEFVDLIRKIIAQKSKIESLQLDDNSLSLTHSDTEYDEGSTSEDEQLEQHPSVENSVSLPEPQDKQAPLEQESLEEHEVQPQSAESQERSQTQTKRPLTKEERIIRAERKFAQITAKAKRHVVSMGLRTSSISDENEKIKPLTIKFINQAVGAQYNDWSATNADGKGVTTLPELIKDIQLKPWGTKGLGQPEVLKEKRYRGCISRRIGGEQASGLADRFVYKVTGPAEITVLAVGGHYE